MKIFIQISIFTLIIAFIFSSFTIDKRTEKKLRKDVKSSFDIENVNFTKIDAKNILIGDDVYLVKSENKIIAYAYLGKADSRSEKIDYSIIFDLDGVIKKVTIVKYRENYGGEIGSKRWLKQFIGKTNGREMKYRNEISAISGATISVRSMIQVINDASIFVYSNKENFNEN